MSATFFDLMKYASTGIASPSMTAYDKMRALAAFGGGAVQTLTDVPPLSFKSNGNPLISWSMLGNGSQSGTPTPDAPIMPDFCGVRTGNLAPPTWAQDFETRVNNYSLAHVGTDGSRTFLWYNVSVGYQDYDNKYIFKTDFKPNTQYTFCFEGMRPEDQGDSAALRIQYTDDTTTNCYIYSGGGYRKYAFTSEAGKTVKYIRAGYTSGVLNIDINTFMCVEGTTALPYEPYGYKIPITCAGQTTPVYLGQVQTARRIKKLVLTGEEDWTRTANNKAYYINSEKGCPTDYLKSKIITVICSHYVGQTNTSSGSNAVNNGCVCFYTGGGCEMYIGETTITSAADFKTYLQQQYAAGTPVTVWYVIATPKTGIFNEPLCKIGDYADELHSTDAGVSIPTAKGQNTLTVDTELQPSEMTITFK